MAKKISGVANKKKFSRFARIFFLPHHFKNAFSATAGYDEIPMHILKLVINHVAHPLSNIINHSLVHGIFPDNLKTAKVCPLFKSGDKKVISNYRPISVLTSFSKIFETIVSNRLTSYLAKHNIINTSQFGFRKHHSTYMPLIEMYEKITLAMDKNEYSIGIFIDLAKAFDTINHDILIRKLAHYGIRGIALNWFISYLHNRSQYVYLDKYSSMRKQITIGVPQGSVLGPLLFIIYINDIVVCSNLLKPLLFADDTNLFYSDKNIEHLRITVEEELDKLSTWFRINRLSLNVSKTNFILFGKKPVPAHFEITIDKLPIARVDCIKFLGVLVDSRLSWSAHIDYIATKIAKSLGAINRIKTILPRKLLITLYYSMVYPYLNYCCIVWGGACPTILSKLIILQKRAIRILSHAPSRMTHSNPLFINLSLLKFDDIYLLRTAEFMFNHFNNALPPSCSKYLPVANPVRTHDTRQLLIYRPAFARSNVRLNSISVRGPKIWNLLPLSITSSLPLSVFKRTLTAHLLSNYSNILVS